MIVVILTPQGKSFMGTIMCVCVCIHKYVCVCVCIRKLYFEIFKIKV